MTINTFNLLIEDHKKVKSIIEHLLDSKTDSKIKQESLLQELKRELKLHQKIEEELVYPILEDKKSMHDLTLEAYQEHHIVEVLLQELLSLDFTDENWKSKLTVLQENLLHHIQEEEEDLFVKAKTDLTSDELTLIKTNISKAKKVSEAK